MCAELREWNLGNSWDGELPYLEGRLESGWLSKKCVCMKVVPIWSEEGREDHFIFVDNSEIEQFLGLLWIKKILQYCRFSCIVHFALNYEVQKKEWFDSYR